MKQHRHGRRHANGPVVCLALAALVSPLAVADEVDGVVRASVSQTRQLGERFDGWRSTVDLRWNRQISRPWFYRLSVRWAGSDQEPLLAGQPLGETENSEIEPRFEIRWVPETFELSAGGRWLTRRNRVGDEPAVDRRETNYFAQFRTTLENRPELRLEYDRRARELSAGGEDVTNRLLGQLSYVGDGWRASGGRRRFELDQPNGLERTSDENLLSASVNRQWLEGELSVFASYNLSDTTTRDRLTVETLVDVPRVVARGLSALDLQPLDGALTNTPALVDGDLGGATSINIGGGFAGGQVGWNIGFELALIQPVSAIDLWLSDPIPAVSGPRYRFEIYVSDDNLTWALADPSPNVDYDEIDGRFRLTFTPIAERYIKVVNTTIDDALGAVFVSEIDPLDRELRRGTFETETDTENISASFGWNPSERFGTQVTGFRSDVSSKARGQVTSSETTTGTVTFSFRPSDVLTGSFSTLSLRRRRTDLPTDTTLSNSLTLTALPVEDLDLTLVVTRSDQERGLADRESVSFLFRVATLLYRDLALSMDYGEADEESLDGPARFRQGWRASLDTRLREEIELNSSLLSEKITTPSLPLDQQIQRNVNWATRLVLRPSSMLNISLEGTYFKLTDESGWARVLELDWLPFAGGALQISFDFRDDTPFNGQTRRLRGGRIRWNMNRKTQLDFDASRQRREALDGTGIEARTLLTLSFQTRF